MFLMTILHKVNEEIKNLATTMHRKKKIIFTFSSR